MLHPQISHTHVARVIWFTRLITLTILVSLLAVIGANAQNPDSTAKDQSSDKPAPPTYPDKVPDDPFRAQLIPRNSKVYIEPIKSEDPNKPQAQGFESYIAAALRKKGVPLLIVADRSQADFVIAGSQEHSVGETRAEPVIGETARACQQARLARVEDRRKDGLGWRRYGALP